MTPYTIGFIGVGHIGSQIAKAATETSAAQEGDLAVVAVPLSGIEQLSVEPLAGKVVATTNYNPQLDGHIAELDTGTATVAGLIQAHLPYSRVVRAFSHISAAEVTTDGEPEGTPNRRSLAIAGDDADARRVVADLYNQVGFDTVDIGGLDASWRIDRGQPAFIVPSERRRASRECRPGQTADVILGEEGTQVTKRMPGHKKGGKEAAIAREGAARTLLSHIAASLSTAGE
jgi:predicted dinucleotide-binding enzyme